MGWFGNYLGVNFECLKIFFSLWKIREVGIFFFWLFYDEVSRWKLYRWKKDVKERKIVL